MNQSGTKTRSIFPSISEVIWYVCIRYLWNLAVRMEPEHLEHYLKRVARMAGHIAKIFPAEYAVAIISLSHGLAETVFFRCHKLSVEDYMSQSALESLKKFRDKKERSEQTIYVSAHMGAVELQLDLLDERVSPVAIMYQSYNWKPLSDLMFRLRSPRSDVTYVPVSKISDLRKHLANGSSLIIVADRPANVKRAIQLFGAPLVNSFPIRLAYKRNLPVHVGGFYHLPNGSFGFSYEQISGADFDELSKNFGSALERYIEKNPSDWVYFGSDRPDVKMQTPVPAGA